MSIIPRGQNKKPANVKSIPPFTIDGKADERFNKFYRSKWELLEFEKKISLKKNLFFSVKV